MPVLSVVVLTCTCRFARKQEGTGSMRAGRCVAALYHCVHQVSDTLHVSGAMHLPLAICLARSL
jgi:hypothetical protein